MARWKLEVVDKAKTRKEQSASGAPGSFSPDEDTYLQREPSKAANGLRLRLSSGQLIVKAKKHTLPRLLKKLG
ncbi:hypothetical protein [Hymenobacter sp. BT190]|uniref:hypothetical protein n=1 Tax=Hymenobacter sp. BT190 TaxID=2763505 RepID=UPI00165172ED|nr:hypothetical protein [Hymenobacter sp. BT190]MBC6698448.1 hypothetical protein [Hymenobacter sp. BT190]